MPPLLVPHPTEDANTGMTSVPVNTEASVDVSSLLASCLMKVKREIMRFGVEQAMSRWRVISEYFQTEDWWPAVARDVEALFDEAYEKRNRLQEERDNRQQSSTFQVNNNISACSPVGIGTASQVVASNKGEVSFYKHQ